MLHLILTLGLALPLNPVQDGQDPVDALEAAVEDRATIRTVRALAAAGEMEDPRVVKACFQALRLEDPTVQLAAIEALRFNSQAGALQVLHSQLLNGQLLNGQLLNGSGAIADPAIEIAIVRATAQHASEGSVPLLAKGQLDPTRPVLGRARILGLGKIGTRRGVRALVNLASELSPDHHLLFADDLRLALQHATGEDHGLNLDAWKTWWASAGAGYEPPVTVEAPPTLCALEWDGYWSSRAALRTPAPAIPATAPTDRAAQAVEASANAAPARGKNRGAGNPPGGAKKQAGAPGQGARGKQPGAGAKGKGAKQAQGQAGRKRPADAQGKNGAEPGSQAGAEAEPSPESSTEPEGGPDPKADGPTEAQDTPGDGPQAADRS